jgi:hypothetical protein
MWLELERQRFCKRLMLVRIQPSALGVLGADADNRTVSFPLAVQKAHSILN